MNPEQIKELVDRVRLYETDHIPDGWPAVQTKELSALADAIEQLQIEANHYEGLYLLTLDELHLERRKA